MLQKVRPPKVQEPAPRSTPAATATSDAETACPTPSAPRSSGILVNYGVHSGSYPVANMTVAQVRNMLSTLVNLDPRAVAVIAGEIVEDEDERRVLAEDHMLSFVRRSSVKGAIGAGVRREEA